MNGTDLLTTLSDHNIVLWLEGDQLRYRAPKGALTPGLRDMLLERKSEVIDLLRRSAREDVTTHPLSYGQRALWFICQAAPRNYAYHVAFSARMRTEVDIEALRQAAQALVDRHSSLRTTYAVVDGEPVQQVHGYVECPFYLTTVTGKHLDEIRRQVIDAYREPFDLEKRPLFRAHVFTLDKQDAVLLLTAHHIACDGWSFMLLLEELRALYAANKAKTAAVLPGPRSEFVAWVEWQRHTTDGEPGERSLSYWRNKLHGELPVLDLPTDKPRPAVQSYNGATQPFLVDADTTQRLKSLARQQDTTLFTVLLSAFHVLLHSYTGQEDIIVGSPTYGRNGAEFSNLVGDLINTIALRGDLSGDPVFTGFVGQMRGVVLGALEHQDYPFPLLVEKLRLTRDSGRPPVYQVLFILQKFSVESDLQKFLTLNADNLDFGGIEMEPFPIGQQEGQLELTLEMGESEDRLFGNIKYNTDLFEGHTIERMVQKLSMLLKGVAMKPETRLSELAESIESESERQAAAYELLSQLRRLGVRVSAEDGRLRMDAPRGAVTPGLRDRISNRKTDILRILAGSGSVDDDAMPLLKAPRDESLCLSSSQERLWFLYRLEPDDISYNISVCLSMEGRLRLDVLERTLSEIMRRHESLRTTFADDDGRPVQVISPASPLRLEVIDLRGISEGERRQKAYLTTTEEVRRLFDLRRGPLIRVVLLRLGDESHLLVVTIHHIVADGWSLGILGREFEALYRAFANGLPSPLPELPVQYADFAYSHTLSSQGKALGPHLSFWRQKLSDIPFLQLPTDRPRPAVQRHCGAKKWFSLSASLRERLVELAQRSGVTPFMALLAAFDVLLQRYTGQTDFGVGTPIANRSRAELEGLIGFFANTLVLRTDLSGDPSFVELLQRVKETTLEALGHQEAPLEKVVEAVNPSRDMSYSPLFQVMFAFQNFPWNKMEIEDLTIALENADSGSSTFDLSFYMWEEEGRLKGYVEYSSDILDASTIDRMLGHFETLLGDAFDNPTRHISELRLVSEPEEQKILAELNRTSAPYPKDKCFGRLFEEQVERTPEAIAVMCAGTSLTYRELNSRANRVAHYLREHGAGPDIIVGMHVERSVDMAVGLLGILKAGSAYLPLDPHFPADRIEYMLEDSHARCLMSQGSLAKDIGHFSGEVICIDSGWEKIAVEDDSNPESLSGPGNLAYVIYTSGSTGKPKGVPIPHRALVNFLYSMQREPGLTADDVLLSVTTMSFDIFGLELYLPLLTGGKVVIAERYDALDGSKLSSLIDDHHVSVMQATPATWRLLIDSGWSGDRNLRAICGGEAMPKDLVPPLLDRCKELWNLYGPTETTIWSTAFKVRSADDPVLIGRPIDNTQIYILDRRLQPVPFGIVGELYIGGDGLSPGYLNRPELTSEKFVHNPFGDDPDARIYQTGDLARYLPDGNIECLGRIDHQVKLRGFRIELGEIETRIKDVETVANCVVSVREDDPGDQRLVAYYVAREGRTVLVQDVDRHLHSVLPEYMVPQVFMQLGSIPLTPNGKVDRRALPRPEGVKPTGSAYVAPQTELEQAVTAIWREVLKTDKVGMHDNFFELGGHSLLMVQVLSKVKALGRKEVSMVELFQNPTIASLCTFLADGRDKKPAFQRVRDRIRMREEAGTRQQELRNTRGTTNE